MIDLTELVSDRSVDIVPKVIAVPLSITVEKRILSSDLNVVSLS